MIDQSSHVDAPIPEARGGHYRKPEIDEPSSIFLVNVLQTNGEDGGKGSRRDTWRSPGGPSLNSWQWGEDLALCLLGNGGLGAEDAGFGLWSSGCAAPRPPAPLSFEGEGDIFASPDHMYIFEYGRVRVISHEGPFRLFLPPLCRYVPRLPGFQRISPPPPPCRVLANHTVARSRLRKTRTLPPSHAGARFATGENSYEFRRAVLGRSDTGELEDSETG
ncbi:hypothetical protein NL676_026586 [Syzygium grande]|nr:hypothetical protein NL676_026586 [Syzygium grande]